jgi:hypothetical protein
LPLECMITVSWKNFSAIFFENQQIMFIGGTQFFTYQPEFSFVLNSVRPNLKLCI